MIQDKKINNIYDKQHENQNNNIGPCHAINGPHLIKDCEHSVYKRCKPNLDTHTPAGYPRKRPPSRQQKSNSSIPTTTVGISPMVTMT